MNGEKCSNPPQYIQENIEVIKALNVLANKLS